ncbi:MAG: hypothetical protein QXJ97_04070 [Desulfurococcaceae archaeon]
MLKILGTPKTEKLLGTPYIDKLRKLLKDFIGRLIEELAKHGRPSYLQGNGTVHRAEDQAHSKMRYHGNQIIHYHLHANLPNNTSYNLIRYPALSNKFDMCRDEGLTKFKEVENLCSKTFISSKDVVAEETYVKEITEIAIEVLKETARNLNQILSNIKTQQST